MSHISERLDRIMELLDVGCQTPMTSVPQGPGNRYEGPTTSPNRIRIDPHASFIDDTETGD